MKCNSCGKEIKEFDVVCSHCGADVNKSEITVMEPAGEEKAKKTPLNRRAGTLALGIILLSVISFIAVLAVFIGSAGKKSANFTYAPVRVGDTVFYNTGENFVRKNSATDEIMASRFVNGNPISFAVIGKNICYISENSIYKTDFSLEGEKKLIDDATCAVVWKNEIYFIPASNPSQLKKCDLNGKNVRLVTVLGDGDRAPALKMAASRGVIYVLKGEKLYLFNAEREELSVMFEGKSPVSSLFFAKENGAVVYKDGVNRLYLSGMQSGSFNASVSASAVWNRSVYGAVVSDNGLTAGAVNVKKGTMTESLKLTANGEIKIIDVNADGKGFFIFASVNEGGIVRYGVYEITASGGSKVIYSNISEI